MLYKDFVSFMNDCVLPHRQKHLNDIRLDGERTGGKRKAFAHFVHNGREWKVDEDTHYEPLEIALSVAEAGQDPFVESNTATGKTQCLSLKSELRKRQSTAFKHLYIYSK